MPQSQSQPVSADKVLLEHGHALSFANCLWPPSGWDSIVESTAYKTKTKTPVCAFTEKADGPLPWWEEGGGGGQAGTVTPSQAPRVYVRPLLCTVHNASGMSLLTHKPGHITTCSEPIRLPAQPKPQVLYCTYKTRAPASSHLRLYASASPPFCSTLPSTFERAVSLP